MKRLMSCLMALCLVLAGLSTAFGMTLEEFRNTVQEFRSGKISPQEFRTICLDVFNNQTANDRVFRIVAYSNLWEAHIMNNDATSAKALAERATAEFPDLPLGYQLMSDTYAMEADPEMATAWLRKAADKTTGAQDKQRLLQRVEDMPYRINNFMPLWADWDENRLEAEKVYKSQQVTIRGVVTNIGKNAAGNPFVEFSADKAKPRGIRCVFSSKTDDAAKLKKGQAVTISGTCTGMADKFVLVENSSVRDK